MKESITLPPEWVWRGWAPIQCPTTTLPPTAHWVLEEVQLSRERLARCTVRCPGGVAADGFGPRQPLAGGGGVGVLDAVSAHHETRKCCILWVG